MVSFGLFYSLEESSGRSPAVKQSLASLPTEIKWIMSE